jgi:hypothetical protein
VLSFFDAAAAAAAAQNAIRKAKQQTSACTHKKQRKAEEAAAHRVRLRRHRAAISWERVFGVGLFASAGNCRCAGGGGGSGCSGCCGGATGGGAAQPSTRELEALLPLAAYGFVDDAELAGCGSGGAAGQAPGGGALTPRHLRRLVEVRQAVLDYLCAVVAQTGAAAVRPATAGSWWFFGLGGFALRWLCVQK